MPSAKSTGLERKFIFPTSLHAKKAINLFGCNSEQKLVGLVHIYLLVNRETKTQLGEALTTDDTVHQVTEQIDPHTHTKRRWENKAPTLSVCNRQKASNDLETQD